MKDIRIVFHYLYVDVQCSNTFVDDKTLYDYYLNKLLSLGSIKIKKIRSFYFIFFLQYSIFLHVDLNFLTSIFFPPLQRTHFNIVWKAVLPEILSIFVWESPCFSLIWRNNFGGYKFLGWWVFLFLFLSQYFILFYSLLTCMISEEKLEVSIEITLSSEILPLAVSSILIKLFFILLVFLISKIYQYFQSLFRITISLFTISICFAGCLLYPLESWAS